MQVQNIQPIDSTCFFPVDDKDCPDVGDDGGDQDGNVCDGEGDGDAVYDGGRLADQAEVGAHHYSLSLKLHTSQQIALKCMWNVHFHV